MDRENLKELLNHFKQRRDYFNNISFTLNAKDLNDAIKAIEDLMQEIENNSSKKTNDPKEDNSQETKSQKEKE